MLEILLRLKEILAAALASALFFFGFSVQQPTPLAVSTATSTSATSTSSSTATTTAPKTSTTTPTKATTTPQKTQKQLTPSTKIAEVIIQPPAPLVLGTTTEEAPAPVTAPRELLNLTEQNAQVRAATVNVVCQPESNTYFSPISGSGIIIDPRGIILTNAHIGQYFLLKDFQHDHFVECIIRTGSPAAPAFRAELMYISENWVRTNAQRIRDRISLGNGKYDFALLRITGPVASSIPFPSEFPHILPSPGLEFIPNDLSVLLASYPAELIGSIATARSLQQVSSVSIIKRAYYFENEDKIDLLSLGGNIIAQGGSSGGAVVSRENNRLLGIIVTTTEGKTTDERDLNAVTVAHISDTLKSETGSTLLEFLNFDPASRTEAWRNLKFEELKKLLESALLAS